MLGFASELTYPRAVTRASRSGFFTLVLTLAACAGGEGGGADEASAGYDVGDGTGSDVGSGTSTSADTSTTSSTSSTASTTSSTTGAEDSATDEGEDTGEPCPLGSESCPCDAGVCDDGLACIEDVCEMPLECPADENEPNDGEQSATSLGEFNDCDGNGGSVSGVLGLGDEDWFTYIGDDDFGCIVDPDREIVTDGAVRICKFAECLNGLPNTDLSCPPGTMSAMSPAGRPGCCGSSGFNMGVFNCTGTIDDSAYIYIRIDQGSPQCVEYTLNYHY